MPEIRYAVVTDTADRHRRIDPSTGYPATIVHHVEGANTVVDNRCDICRTISNCQFGQLVTTGFYARLRHPIYVFGTMAFLLVLLALQGWQALVVAHVGIVSW